ncbi:MAG: type II toxin-antitoxin system VapC family toxin [Candidatus Acidiferrales bacterium]
MILLDSNLLIYAHVSTLSQHHAAKDWLEEKLNGPAPVGLPWASLLSFVRVVSNSRFFREPETVQAAWAQAESWLDSPVAWNPLPTERHRETLRTLITTGARRANLVPDAHLAALAIEHGLTLCTTDGDFARFPGLRWENPVA